MAIIFIFEITGYNYSLYLHFKSLSAQFTKVQYLKNTSV